MASIAPLPLSSRLASALPSSFRLSIHHIISEPFSCPELFSTPPNEAPEPTVCESHFLSASIIHSGEPLQVFAIEVLVYTTDTLTTLFVSKADSTGYLKLLNLLEGTPSPIKAVLSTFLEYLVEIKRRKDARLVLSLFARAQNQYLFPGSIENPDKHVLDDRGLIKWWCRVVNPILDNYAPRRTPPLSNLEPVSTSEPEFGGHAYLVVPGCDAYETRAYFPRGPQLTLVTASRWTAGDPLEKLGKSVGLPPRCYIPRFPDDPKARFVTDLDDELPEPAEGSQELPLDTSQTGRWRSVRSLAQFWELMAFRQECAAGRLVGFLWTIFEPWALCGKPLQAKVDIDHGSNGISAESQEEPQLPTPQDSQHREVDANHSLLYLPSSPCVHPKVKTPLSPLTSSQPQVQEENMLQASEETHPTDAPAASTLTQLKCSASISNGAVVLTEPAYKRAMEVLQRTDYANLEVALKSTRKFLSSVAEEVNSEGWGWGYEVCGEIPKSDPPVSNNTKSQESVTNLDKSMDGNVKETLASQVQTLGAGLIRKKKRAAADLEENNEEQTIVPNNDNEPEVLGLGIVRKKPKV